MSIRRNKRLVSLTAVSASTIGLVGTTLFAAFFTEVLRDQNDKPVQQAAVLIENGNDSGSAYIFDAAGTPGTCPWDLDDSGMVGTGDLLALFAQWGTAGPADFDKSGAVNTADLLILFANWGPCP